MYYKLLLGNIREVRAFKNWILEAGLNDVVIVADKVFYSKKILNCFKNSNFDSFSHCGSSIDYAMLEDNSFIEGDCCFEHEKHIIWYQKDA